MEAGGGVHRACEGWLYQHLRTTVITVGSADLPRHPAPKPRGRKPFERHVRLDVRIVHHTGIFCVSVATAKIYLDSRLIIPSENTTEGFRDRTTAVFTIATSHYKQGG